MSLRYVTEKELTLHWELNRSPDTDHVFALMQHMETFGGYDERYPIEAMEFDNALHVFSGHHRLSAAFGQDLTFPLLPLEKVPVRVVQGDMNALIERMWNAHDQNNPKKNPAFGLQLTREQEKTQRLIQLSFPHVFRQSSAIIGKEWNVSAGTVDNFRREVITIVQRLLQRNHDAETLLSTFHYTPERLAEMDKLIKSGERVGADGRVRLTQASEAKKAESREELVAACRERIGEIKATLTTLCDERFTHLQSTDLKRRLYAAWNCNHAGNVSRWALPMLKKEYAGLGHILQELQDEASAWMSEFSRIHKLYEGCDKLREISENKPILREAQTLLSQVGEIQLAAWESRGQEERLAHLDSLLADAPGILVRESDAQKEAAAARALSISVKGTSRACSALVTSFKTYKEVLKGANYADFITAACRDGGYSRQQLEPNWFLQPADTIADEATAHRVRDIADRIRSALISEKPPAWMSPFLKAGAREAVLAAHREVVNRAVQQGVELTGSFMSAVVAIYPVALSPEELTRCTEDVINESTEAWLQVVDDVASDAEWVQKYRRAVAARAQQIASLEARWIQVREEGVVDIWRSRDGETYTAAGGTITADDARLGTWRLHPDNSTSNSPFFHLDGPRTIEMSETLITVAEGHVRERQEAVVAAEKESADAASLASAHTDIVDATYAELTDVFVPARLPNLSLSAGDADFVLHVMQPFTSAARDESPQILSDRQVAAKMALGRDVQVVRDSIAGWKCVKADLQRGATPGLVDWLDAYTESVHLHIAVADRWAALHQANVSDKHVSGQWQLILKGEKKPFHLEFAPFDVSTQARMAHIAEEYLASAQASAAFRECQEAVQSAERALDTLFASFHDPGLGVGHADLRQHLGEVCLPAYSEAMSKRALAIATAQARGFIETEMVDDGRLRKELTLVDAVLHTYLSSPAWTGRACTDDWRSYRDAVSICSSPDEIVALRTTGATSDERLLFSGRLASLQSFIDRFSELEKAELGARQQTPQQAPDATAVLKSALIQASEILGQAQEAINDTGHCSASSLRILNAAMSRQVSEPADQVEALRCLMVWLAKEL